MDRIVLPGYDPDPTKCGAIDFVRWPVLTHPTSEAQLQLQLPDSLNQKELAAKLEDLVRNIWHQLTSGSRFKNDPTSAAAAAFHVIHHYLREKLAQDNVGGLGALWYRLPADTRIPDHSIWQHCALVSALASCFALSKTNQASLLVFSLTPVQEFITRARKLRDFWVGSVLLSWLTFAGLKAVICELGSDHVIYPSLVGQPLVDQLFAREFGLESLGLEKKPDRLGFASFPNKFVCLVPSGQEKEMADKIETAVKNAWEDLGNNTLEFVEKLLGKQDPCLGKQFGRQLPNFWDCRWAAAALVTRDSLADAKGLLRSSVWQGPEALDTAAAHLRQCQAVRIPADYTKGEGSFYPVSHALAQAMLAAGKTSRDDKRAPEPGIKCSLHSDLEILHYEWQPGEDRNPRPAADPFWREFKEQYKGKYGVASDFKASERLSSVGLIKRLAPQICQQDHPLEAMFQEAERFPSTTEVALSRWLDQVEKLGLPQHFPSRDNWRQKLAQYFHEQEPETPTEETDQEITTLGPKDREAARKIFAILKEWQALPGDEGKYYAILVMDGDHMGKLINGETLGATWKSVLNPELAKRFQGKNFVKEIREFWEKWLPERRAMAPGVHAAISEALADFSLHYVPAIIRRHVKPEAGRLIYAGGDDVCAILPVAAALQVAQEIAQAYRRCFVWFSDDGEKEVTGRWAPQPGRLAVLLGQAPEISISGAILIAHHKRPLAQVMRRAQELLKEKAKKFGGRNALAIELAKRGGGPRLLVAQWDERPWSALQLAQEFSLWEHFERLIGYLGQKPDRELSTSLLYGLEDLRPGLQALVEPGGGRPEKIPQFIKSLLKKSDVQPAEAEDLEAVAEHISALIVRQRPGQGKPAIDLEPLPLAIFFSRCRAAGNDPKESHHAGNQAMAAA